MSLVDYRGLARLSRIGFNSVKNEFKGGHVGTRVDGINEKRSLQKPYDLLLAAGYLGVANNVKIDKYCVKKDGRDFTGTGVSPDASSTLGIFNQHPLMLRMVEKISGIIKGNFKFNGEATEFRMSPFQTRELWEVSGRWKENDINNNGSGRSEFLNFSDRHGRDFLFSPTAEEAVVATIKQSIHSSSELPIRVFQISEKFRDESRPKHGLLRAREFIMADLYTFDTSKREAFSTYQSISDLMYYIFSGCTPIQTIEDSNNSYYYNQSINLPRVIRAQADSGSIGGDTSEEYHVISKDGEDTIVYCSKCTYASNLEKAEAVMRINCNSDNVSLWNDSMSIGYYLELYTTVYYMPGKRNVYIVPKHHHINTLSISPFEDSHKSTNNNRSVNINDYQHADLSDKKVYNEIINDNSHLIFDRNVVANAPIHIQTQLSQMGETSSSIMALNSINEESAYEYTCKHCTSRLMMSKSIEIGHSFLLGDKYTKGFGLGPSFLPHIDAKEQYVQMGCYGIGVSRLVAVMAEIYRTKRGFSWPPHLAPYKLVIIPIQKPTDCGTDKLRKLIDALLLRDPSLRDEILIDDRYKLSNSVRINDVFVLGIPHVVLIGSKSKSLPDMVEFSPLNELHENGSASSFQFTHITQIYDKLIK